MRTLELENYGVMEMNLDDSLYCEGGGPWWYELGKALLHSAAYDILKTAVTTEPKFSPSGAYHDIMKGAR